MNEVKKCSISGIAFTMDTDAYAALRSYLDTLNERYGKEPDGEEIIADIEARIAEIILSTQNNGCVVERPLIENIIAQLGSADAISEESDTEVKREPKNEPHIPRRLYRDMESAKLGGVCAGVARYFDIDPVWIRLTMFVPLLLMPFSGISAVWFSLSAICGNLFGMFILTYLVLWFSIPVARSPRQKLEMKGEKITEQSIRDNATGSPSDADHNARPIIADTVTVFGKIVLILFKIFAAFIIFGISMAVLALIIGLIAVAITEGSICHFGTLSEVLTLTGSELAVSILGILTILVPAILLLYVLICLFISRKPRRTASITLFILWILIFLALCVTAIKTSHDIHSIHPLDRLDNRIELIEDAVEAKADKFEDAAEAIEQAVERGDSITITTSDGTKISVFDTKKSGGVFRKTTINIDK